MNGLFLTNKNVDKVKVSKTLLNLDLKLSDKFEEDKIFIWNGEPDITPQRANLCFGWLDSWEVIAAFKDYKILLKDIIKTYINIEKFIPDLRIPVYETGAFFLRNNEAGNLFWNEFLNLSIEYENNVVGFSIALWKVKPFILTLPCNWFVK